MPVYEYQCVENGHRFDLYQGVGADAPACPVCGSATRKVYSSVGLIFKGSGFHVTDYRRPAEGEKVDGKGDGKPAPEAKTPPPTTEGGTGATAKSSESAGGGASKKASDA